MTDETEIPGNLPETFPEMSDNEYRTHLVEERTTRDQLVRTIADQTDILRETDSAPMTHLELARVLKAVGGEDGTEYRIRRYRSKNDILQDIDDALDKDLGTDETQSNFRKGQLARIFLELWDSPNRSNRYDSQSDHEPRKVVA